MSYLLEIENLSVRFGTVHALQDVSLMLAPAEKLAIIGESGSGKSVMALTILRLLESAQTDGKVIFEGKDLLKRDLAEMQSIRGADIAMVFQDPMTSLNPVYTVGRQILDVLRAHTDSDDARRKCRAIELLDQVGLKDPERCLSLYPHELSGGMRQRVMIAMAIACEPKVLIADEPTTALDVTVQVQITKLLVSLCQQRRIGLIFISHNLDLVGEFADRIAVMHQGKLIEIGSAEAVMGNPSAAYTKRLLSSIPRIQAAEEKRVAAVSRSDEVVVQAQSVNKDFPYARSPFARLFDRRAVRALKTIDLSVTSGEVLGIVGESGSGKSTLARILNGLDVPTTGSVLLNGKPISLATRKDRIKLSQAIQMVFQGSHTSLNPRKTIRTTLREAMAAARIAKRYTPDELMRMVNLDPALLGRYPHQLSGGQRQRVGIARALSVRPQILIADEPTSALDVSVQWEVIELLKSLQRELGMTMIVISHDLGLIGKICDRVVVIRSGEIVERGTAAEVLLSPEHSYTKALIEAVPRGLEGRCRYAPVEKTA